MIFLAEKDEQKRLNYSKGTILECNSYHTLWSGVMAENFTTSERAAGAGLSYQFTVFFGAGVWTAFFTAFLLVNFKGAKGAASYQIGTCIAITVISLIITAVFLRDRKNLPADEGMPTESEIGSGDMVD